MLRERKAVGARRLTFAALSVALLSWGSLAQAQDYRIQPVWEVQIQGGFLWRHQLTAPTTAERVDIGGDAVAVGTDTIAARNNWTGRLGARRRIDEQIDFGLAYTGIGSAGNSRSLSSDFPVALIFPGLITSPITTAAGGFAIEARTRAIQHIVDFDLGYDLRRGGSDALKLIGGVRFTWFSQTTDLTLPDALFPTTGEFTHRRKDEFIGAGPRIAVQWSRALGDGFSFDVASGASILFGQQKIRTTTVGFGGVATGAFNEEHGRVAYNGEGEIALAYRFTINAQIALGYQASAWLGLRDNRRELDAAATLASGPNPTAFLPGGRRFPIDVTHGPFVRVAFRW